MLSRAGPSAPGGGARGAGYGATRAAGATGRAGQTFTPSRPVPPYAKPLPSSPLLAFLVPGPSAGRGMAGDLVGSASAPSPGLPVFWPCVLFLVSGGLRATCLVGGGGVDNLFFFRQPKRMLRMELVARE